MDIHGFIDQGGIRVMEMGWLDGYDLREVLSPPMLERTRARLPLDRWRYVNRVILEAGPLQTRLKPGVAIAVLRDCLAGLAALHRDGIVHGDLKPANVLLKRAGNAKLIDIGSAVDLRGAGPRRVWSPAYAAPEVLQGGENTPRSDLASLGSVLVELLALCESKRPKSPIGHLRLSTSHTSPRKPATPATTPRPVPSAGLGRATAPPLTIRVPVLMLTGGFTDS